MTRRNRKGEQGELEMGVICDIIRSIGIFLLNLGIYFLLFCCGVVFIRLCERRGFKQAFGEFGTFFIPVMIFLIVLILFY